MLQRDPSKPYWNREHQHSSVTSGQRRSTPLVLNTHSSQLVQPNAMKQPACCLECSLSWNQRHQTRCACRTPSGPKKLIAWDANHWMVSWAIGGTWRISQRRLQEKRLSFDSPSPQTPYKIGIPSEFEFLNDMYNKQLQSNKLNHQWLLLFYFFSMSRRKFWGHLTCFSLLLGSAGVFLEHAISAADGAVGGSPTARWVCRQFGTFCIHRESITSEEGKCNAIKGNKEVVKLRDCLRVKEVLVREEERRKNVRECDLPMSISTLYHFPRSL